MVFVAADIGSMIVALSVFVKESLYSCASWKPALQNIAAVKKKPEKHFCFSGMCCACRSPSFFTLKYRDAVGSRSEFRRFLRNARQARCGLSQVEDRDAVE